MPAPVVVNFFGGPGVGKSTTAAMVFALLKAKGFEAEYIPEFAKVLTWADHQVALRDQLYVFAKQDHRLEVLRDQALDFIVVDSPLLNSLIYAPPGYYASFRPLVLEVFRSYHNRNFLLSRDTAYSPVGRNETAAHAQAKCLEVAHLLQAEAIPHEVLPGATGAAEAVVRRLLSK